MTLTDNLITIRFYFQQGWGEIGTYVGLATFGLMVMANLTLKGIYFPVWGLIPVAIACLVVGVALGWFMVTRDITQRANSRMTLMCNKEFKEVMDDIKAIKEKLDIPR